MELRHLRYFVAVVEEEQFVRAAHSLHVAQSALSQQIRDLERELGVELLVRDRRGVFPTAAGEVLLGHARALLERAERAKAEVAQLAGVVTGTLRIGSGSPTGPVPLPATLAEYGRRYPEVDLVLRDTTSAELVHWLQDGTVDVALLTITPERLPDRIEGALVGHEPMLALVAATHPLAARRRIPLGALAGEPFITFPRGSGVRDTIEQGFRDAGVPRPPIVAEMIDPLAMVELVGEGLGVALVSTAIAELAGARVRALPLTRPGLRGDVTVAWARERRALPALDAFLELAAGWM